MRGRDRRFGSGRAAARCALLAVAMAGWGCHRGPAVTEHLTGRGSDTMLPLVMRWAEAYTEGHPSADFAVAGGGSGTGIVALLDQTVDFCAASRAMNAAETKLAAQRGFVPVEHVVARDGLAIVVHPANPVSEASIDQLHEVFAGRILRWDALGGPAQPIRCYGRTAASGTFSYVREHVLGNEAYGADTRLLPTTATIVEAVAGDPNGIGYVGLGYARAAGATVKVLALTRDAASVALLPTEETVMAGTYPLARLLRLYTRGEPLGLLREFIDYCIGPAGQRIVEEKGYVQIAR